MNIKIKNDIKNKKMTISVTVKRQKLSRDPVEIFKRYNALDLLKDYTPPAGYDLGACIKDGKKVDNRHDNKLHGEWVFELVKKMTIKKPKMVSKKESSEA